MRKSSPETCCVRLSSQKKPTDATMLPHSRTAAAMPRKPAVMRRRSVDAHTRTHTVISAGNEGTQNIAVVTTPWYCYIKLMVCFHGNSDWQ